MDVSIQIDVEKAVKRLQEDRNKLPFVLSRALNATAKAVSDYMPAVFRRTLDRPVDFTLRSVTYKASTKANLKASIEFKEGQGAKDAENWMQHEIQGGQRAPKAIERKLIALKLLPRGHYIVPASGAQLDVFGNWKRSHFTRILVELGIAGNAAAANQLAKRQSRAKGRQPHKKVARYFVVLRQENGLEPGIYERSKHTALGEAVRPVVLFVAHAPRYRRRVPFFQVAFRESEKRFQTELSKFLGEAIDAN